MCAHVCVLSRVWLYNPMDGNPPGSSVHRVSQTRILSGLSFPPPGTLSNPRIELAPLVAPARVGRFVTTGPGPSIGDQKSFCYWGQRTELKGGGTVSGGERSQSLSEGAERRWVKAGQPQRLQTLWNAGPQSSTPGDHNSPSQGIPRQTASLRKAFPLMYGCAWSLSYVRFFATLWTVARQAPLSLGFSRQEFWVGCHFLPQGIFLPQGSKPSLLHPLPRQADSLRRVACLSFSFSFFFFFKKRME